MDRHFPFLFGSRKTYTGLMVVKIQNQEELPSHDAGEIGKVRILEEILGMDYKWVILFS